MKKAYEKKWEKQRINNWSILKWAYWDKNVSSAKMKKTGAGENDSRVESRDWEPSDVPAAAFLSEERLLQESEVKSLWSMNMKLWQERVLIVCIALKAVQGAIILYKKGVGCSPKGRPGREGWCPSAPLPGAEAPGEVSCGDCPWPVWRTLLPTALCARFKHRFPNL